MTEFTLKGTRPGRYLFFVCGDDNRGNAGIQATRVRANSIKAGAFPISCTVAVAARKWRRSILQKIPETVARGLCFGVFDEGI